MFRVTPNGDEMIAQGSDTVAFPSNGGQLYRIGFRNLGHFFPSSCGLQANGMNGMLTISDDLGGTCPHRWKLPVDGAFDVASNWIPPTVPGPDDAVVFDQVGRYNVILNSNQECASLGVLAGTVRVMGGGRRLGSTRTQITVSGAIELWGCDLWARQIELQQNGVLRMENVAEAGGVVEARLVSVDGLNLDGTLEGNGAIDGPVRHNGCLHPRLTPGGAERSQIVVSGYFTTEPNHPAAPRYTPRIEIDVMEDPHDATSSVVFQDFASLGGTLAINNAHNMAHMETGEQLDVLRISPFAPHHVGFDLSSRFERLEGMWVSADKWVFVNHSYQASTVSGVFAQHNPVRLAIARAPRRWISNTACQAFTVPLADGVPPAGVRRLMLITHGTMSGIPEPNDWDFDESFGDLAARAASFARVNHLGSWDVVTLDWSEYSTSAWTASYNPYESARISRDIARGLAAWLREVEGVQSPETGYAAYHIMGHSSGCHFVDELKDVLVASGVAEPLQVQATYFDAFWPLGMQPDMAEQASYAEHYMTSGPLDLPGTGYDLPFCVNVDVTELRHGIPYYYWLIGDWRVDVVLWGVSAFSNHSWPYRWYLQQIDCYGDPPTCDGPGGNFGWGCSPMAQSLYGPGSPCRGIRRMEAVGSDAFLLPSGGRRNSPGSAWYPYGTLRERSASGTVELAANDVLHMSTGSPVWAQVSYPTEQGASYLSYTLRNETETEPGGPVVFRASVDGVVLVERLLANAADASAGELSGWLVLPRSVVGEVIVEFRMDPVGDWVGPPMSVAVESVQLAGDACNAPPDIEMAWSFEDAGDGGSVGSRSKHAMAWDNASGVCVLFGGLDSTGHVLGDTQVWLAGRWVWDHGTYGPSLRSGHAMCEAPGGGVLLFGGRSESGAVLDDAWLWRNGAWSPVAAGPPARSGHTLTFDRFRGQAVLFGGVGGDGHSLGDTWIWEGMSWRLAATTGPSARSEHCAAFSSSLSGVVLFGGTSAESPPYTWRWSGSSWHHVTIGGPGPRTAATLIPDPLRETLTLVGGRAQGRMLDDQWDLGPAGWQRRPDAVPTGAIADHAAASSVSGLRLLVGGVTGSSGVSDRTWVGTAVVSSRPIVPRPGMQIFAGANTTETSQIQWRLNGAVVQYQPGRIEGTESKALNIIDPDPSLWGRYQAVISNDCGVSVSAPIVVGCPSDFNGDGFLDFFDYDDYVNCFETGSCPSGRDADFNGDGFADFFDYDDFVGAFETGC